MTLLTCVEDGDGSVERAALELQFSRLLRLHNERTILQYCTRGRMPRYRSSQTSLGTNGMKEVCPQSKRIRLLIALWMGQPTSTCKSIFSVNMMAI